MHRLTKSRISLQNVRKGWYCIRVWTVLAISWSYPRSRVVQGILGGGVPPNGEHVAIYRPVIFRELRVSRTHWHRTVARTALDLSAFAPCSPLRPFAPTLRATSSRNRRTRGCGTVAPILANPSSEGLLGGNEYPLELPIKSLQEAKARLARSRPVLHRVG